MATALKLYTVKASQSALAKKAKQTKEVGGALALLSGSVAPTSQAGRILAAAESFWSDPTDQEKRVTLKVLIAAADIEDDLPEMSDGVKLASYVGLAVLGWARKHDGTVEFWARKAVAEFNRRALRAKNRKAPTMIGSSAKIALAAGKKAS
jgi:hypothetical protein